MQNQPDKFFQDHRGGEGAVIAVQVYNSSTGNVQVGIFSSIEKAEKFTEKWDNDDDIACLFIPYIVDEPDWGNSIFH